MRIKDRISTDTQKKLAFGFIFLAIGCVVYMESNPNRNTAYDYRPDGASIRSSWQDSDKNMQFINSLRAKKGLKPIMWDDRAYSLAVARAKDMDTEGYVGDTNPKTGICAISLKSKFGFSENEQVFETTMSYYYPTGGGGMAKAYAMSMQEVFESYVNNPRYSMKDYILKEYHVSGAIGCHGSVCAFITSSKDRIQGECEKS